LLAIIDDKSLNSNKLPPHFKKSIKKMFEEDSELAKLKEEIKPLGPNATE
jgi:hypothetical protein